MAGNTKSKYLHIRLTDTQEERLTEISVAYGRTKTEIITYLIESVWSHKEWFMENMGDLCDNCVDKENTKE